MDTTAIESIKIVKALAPAADRWNTNPVTDAVKLSLHEKLLAIVQQAGGTTGDGTITVEACSAAAGTGAVAIPFRYRLGADGAGAGGDAFGAVTSIAATGLLTTAATDRLYLIEIKASELPAGKPWVRLVCTETTNDPVSGGVIFLLLGGRYAGANPPTVIA